MHPFATDSSERRIVFISIAVLGVALAWTLSGVLGALAFSIPWWVDAPSVAGFYGIIYLTFDRWLWKIPILKSISLIRIPNLAGTWRGEILSSSDSNAKGVQASLIVRQTWSRISLILETDQSRSHSVIATILTESLMGLGVSYEYLSEPNSTAVDTMQIHRGTAWLVFKEGNLEGSYYTGRGRQTNGTLVFSQI